MDTRLATRQIRMAQWTEIIRDRNESGLSIREYCSRNEINRNAYFYWLRKIREAAIESAGAQFVELPEPPDISGENTAPSDGNAGVVLELGGVRIHVDHAACRDTLKMVLEVLGNAQ